MEILGLKCKGISSDVLAAALFAESCKYRNLANELHFGLKLTYL